MNSKLDATKKVESKRRSRCKSTKMKKADQKQQTQNP